MTRSNYFWSPDSKNIAFLQMNETDVPEYPITDWIPTHAAVDMQHYPQPGDPNPDCPRGRGGRGRRQDGVDQAADSGWAGLHSAIWMGGSQDAVDRDGDARSKAPGSLLCRCGHGAGACGAANYRRQISRRQLRRLGGRRNDCADRTGATATTISISTAMTRPIRLRPRPSWSGN